MNALSIRQRLIGLCLFICFIALIPLGLLIRSGLETIHLTQRAEQNGVKPALILLKAVDQLQRHRGAVGPLASRLRQDGPQTERPASQSAKLLQDYAT